MSDIQKGLRDDATWRDIQIIAAFMYDKAEEIAASHPEEAWASASKLRMAANDSVFYIAQIIGATDASGSGYDCNNARKNLFALQTIYIFATKQKLIEIDPEIIVKIDQLIKQVDKWAVRAKEAQDSATKEELDPWLEKYRLWQAMQEKPKD